MIIALKIDLIVSFPTQNAFVFLNQISVFFIAAFKNDFCSTPHKNISVHRLILVIVAFYEYPCSFVSVFDRFAKFANLIELSFFVGYLIMLHFYRFNSTIAVLDSVVVSYYL